jgi:hypothetical protein
MKTMVTGNKMNINISPCKGKIEINKTDKQNKNHQTKHLHSTVLSTIWDLNLHPNQYQLIHK